MIKKLDFRPLKKPSPFHVPLLCQGILLFGDESTDAYQLNQPLDEVIKSIYPDLDLFELFRLDSALTELKINSDRTLNFYGIRDLSTFRRLSEFFRGLDDSIQDHLSSKRFHLNDLRAMYPYDCDFEKAKDYFNFCSGLQLSKTQWVEACQLGFELMAQMPVETNLFESHREAFLEQLRQLRFSNSSKIAKSKQDQINSIPWSRRLSARWIRNGDQSGVEIKISALQPTDLEKAIEHLESVAGEVKKLWNAP